MGNAQLTLRRSGSVKGLSGPRFTVCRSRRRASQASMRSALRVWPPAKIALTQSIVRSGPLHSSESHPPGRSTRATSGSARSSSTQCQAEAIITASKDAVVSRNFLRLASHHFRSWHAVGQHGSHPIIGLDCPDVAHAPNKLTGESSGSSTELEHVDSPLRQQPVDRLIWRSGSKAVVVGRNLSE